MGEMDTSYGETGRQTVTAKREEKASGARHASRARKKTRQWGRKAEEGGREGPAGERAVVTKGLPQPTSTSKKSETG